jgi:exodeoxyribonuclease VII large subunit
LGPTTQLNTASTTVRTLQSRLIFSVTQRLEHQQQKLSALSRMLNSVSPLPTIGRGYGLVTDSNGNVVSSVAGLEPGNQTITYLQDGSIVAQIEEIHPGTTPANRSVT